MYDPTDLTAREKVKAAIKRAKSALRKLERAYENPSNPEGRAKPKPDVRLENDTLTEKEEH